MEVLLETLRAVVRAAAVQAGEVGRHGRLPTQVHLVVGHRLLGGRDRETRAAAVVERLGRTIANVEAFAWQDSRDKPIASARINFLLERQ